MQSRKPWLNIRTHHRNTDTLLAYPSWYPYPSQDKDAHGGEGGQIQMRFSAKRPAVPTWPDDIKSTIASRYPGGVIAWYDISQAELRSAALQSGDPSLLSAYSRGADLHAELAIQVEGPAIVDNPHFGSGITHLDPRQAYKTANFLILFRGEATALQLTLLEDFNQLLPLIECENIIDTLRTMRRGLWHWQEGLIELARRQHYLELPITGISRYFMGGAKHEDNEIVNFPVQATAATLLLSLQRFIEPRLHPHVLFFTNWYDAAYFDCPSPAAALDLRALIDEAFTYQQHGGGYWQQLSNLYGHYVPLVYDFKTKE